MTCTARAEKPFDSSGKSGAKVDHRAVRKEYTIRKRPPNVRGLPNELSLNSANWVSTLAKKFPHLRIVTLMDADVLRGGLYVAQSSLQWQRVGDGGAPSQREASLDHP